jgi:2-dehydro-3-deoxyphosphooctonate aldolase (KDO 8-P synthase)
MKQPIIIAGPCVAESYALLEEVLQALQALEARLSFRLIFKASFDKANRTSLQSYRGPGMETVLSWFSQLKKQYGCKILTDVHESTQVAPVAAVVDYLQIPAFLCRQTDLVIAAAQSGCGVNIKKGQFMAPEAMAPILKKAQAAKKNPDQEIWVTERGFAFGYGDLVVDMRSFHTLHQNGIPVLFDVTHSTQQPPAGKETSISNAQRCYAPLLARSAVATGYVNGAFLEVHPSPSQAKSDAAAQLSIPQATAMLEQLVPMLQQSAAWKGIDAQFG